MTKRSIQVAFPAVEPPSVPTWRCKSPFSDWTLCLGTEKEYKVHRLVLGTGPRSSAFFARAFASEAFGSAAASRTDLSTLLPKQCWGQALEAALDFAYGVDDTDEFSAGDLVLLCKVGDILQMPQLLEACVAALNKKGVIIQATVPEMLGALVDVGGVGQPLQGELEDAIVDIVAAHLPEYVSEAKQTSWPPELLVKALDHERLQVQHEDEVFQIVRQATSGLPERAEKIKLWQKVRFGQLSPSILLEAAQLDEIPKELFVFLAVQRLRLPAVPTRSPPPVFEGLEEGWVHFRHFLPRSYLRLKCAYLFCNAQKDAEDNEYMRDRFAGSSICSFLETLGAVTEKINLARSMKADVLDEFDVVLMSEVFGDAHSSAPRVVSKFLHSGKGVVIYEELFRNDMTCKGFDEILPYVLTRPKKTIRRSDSVIVEATAHPVFTGVHKESHTDCLMECEAALKPGAGVLARWSTGSPYIVEKSHGVGRVVCFSQAMPRPKWWWEMPMEVRQLLVNALAYCAQKQGS